MYDLTILHLSDLHFEPSKIHDVKIVRKALFEDLEAFKTQGVVPNIVVFSGDLIKKGDFGYSEERNDFEKVQQAFIEPLLELLELDIDHFFICPGNHDIQRAEVDRNRYLETGLNLELRDRDSVNDFIDDLDDQVAALPNDKF